MGIRNLPATAAKTLGLLARVLAVVVVLAAMPGHHQGAGQNAQRSQSSSHSDTTVGMNHRDEPAEHPADRRTAAGADDHHMAGMDHGSRLNEGAAVASMTPGHQHNDLHMRMTPRRASSTSDE